MPGTRVTRALIRIVADAAPRRSDGRTIARMVTVSAGTAESFDALRDVIELPDATDATLIALVLAWTQLFGLLSFELFGQTRNFVARRRAAVPRRGDDDGPPPRPRRVM